MQQTQSQKDHHTKVINPQTKQDYQSKYQLTQVKQTHQNNALQTISIINIKDSQKQEITINNKNNNNNNINNNINHNSKFHLPQCLKRQILRLFLIPLLIVLFLLTIALTFKQNNYQTNDYFYSKNIQINRKIRGVVPPLNQTKEDIFGQYRIGLVQYFSVDDRRMLQNFKVQMWRNESMRVSEIGKTDKCWSVYKLKFYSSTIFIEKKQSYLMNVTVKNNRNSNQNESTKDKSKSIEKSVGEDVKKSQSDDRDRVKLNINQTVLPTAAEEKASHTNASQSQSPQQTSKEHHSQQVITVQVQQSLCQLQKWSRINQILSNSHIWTFAEGNFYLMEFSQIEQENNGVLIMKMIQQYPNNV